MDADKPASSVSSTLKPRSMPNARITAIPPGIESCRNPVVLEKTSTGKEGVIISAATRLLVEAQRIAGTTSGPSNCGISTRSGGWVLVDSASS
jgi:hypothetical protein